MNSLEHCLACFRLFIANKLLKSIGAQSMTLVRRWQPYSKHTPDQLRALSHHNRAPNYWKSFWKVLLESVTRNCYWKVLSCLVHLRVWMWYSECSNEQHPLFAIANSEITEVSSYTQHIKSCSESFNWKFSNLKLNRISLMELQRRSPDWISPIQ